MLASVTRSRDFPKNILVGMMVHLVKTILIMRDRNQANFFTIILVIFDAFGVV